MNDWNSYEGNQENTVTKVKGGQDFKTGHDQVSKTAGKPRRMKME